MPKIDAKTLRVAVTIAGYDFTCPQPFSAGHPLSEGEAEALNTLFADRVRTNCARSVKDLETDAIRIGQMDLTDDGQAIVNDYAARYEFASRSDPIRRKALELAKDAIRKKAAGDGIVLWPEVIQSRAETLLVSGTAPQFLEAARKFIELQREVAEEELIRP